MADFVRMGLPAVWIGLSTDTKPATAEVGSRAYETNTGEWYIWNGSSWQADKRSWRYG